MNCAYLTRFKFWATSITFPRTCSIFDSSNNCDPNKYDVQHPPGCSLYSNHHKSRGSVQKRNHTSQPVVVSFMFYQVNDFGIVFHVASKDYSRRHIIHYYQLILLSPQVFFKLFQFFYTAWFFFYTCLSMQLFCQPFLNRSLSAEIIVLLIWIAINIFFHGDDGTCTAKFITVFWSWSYNLSSYALYQMEVCLDSCWQDLSLPSQDM